MLIWRHFTLAQHLPPPTGLLPVLVVVVGVTIAAEASGGDRIKGLLRLELGASLTTIIITTTFTY